MSTKRFPQTQYFKTFEDAEIFLCGGISGHDDQQLAQIIFTLYKHGAHAGTERIRAKIYHDAALTKLYATGDWFDLVDLVNDPSEGEVLSTYWRGRVGLNFSGKPWLDSQSTYYIAAEIDGYARSLNAFYMALMYDWPFPVNSNSNAPNYAIAMEIRGYRQVNYFG